MVSFEKLHFLHYFKNTQIKAFIIQNIGVHLFYIRAFNFESTCYALFVDVFGHVLFRNL